MERHRGKRGEWVEEPITEIGSPEEFMDYSVKAFVLASTVNGEVQKFRFEAFYRGTFLGNFSSKNEALAAVTRHKEDKEEEDKRNKEIRNDNGSSEDNNGDDTPPSKF